jgi:hypothetical protein
MKQNRLVLLAAVVGLWVSGSALAAGTLHVRHDHDPWGSCTGELTITAKGIQYHSDDKEEHSRDWSWTDIQTVDRLSADRFSILTYEDQNWLLGRDRPWDFTVLDPQAGGLTDQLFAVIRQNEPRPLVDRIPRQIKVDYQIPVKHLHTFGGCEGILEFNRDWIVYKTDHKEDARTWRRGKDVASVWSTGPFDLEIEVYEKNGQDLLRTRRYRFELKQPLDEAYYSRLKREFIPAR